MTGSTADKLLELDDWGIPREVIKASTASVGDLPLFGGWCCCPYSQGG